MKEIKRFSTVKLMLLVESLITPYFAHRDTEVRSTTAGMVSKLQRTQNYWLMFVFNPNAADHVTLFNKSWFRLITLDVSY